MADGFLSFGHRLGCALLLGGGLFLLAGIRKGDGVSFIEAGQYGLALAAIDQRDIARRKAVGGPEVYERVAVPLEERLGGEPQYVVQGLGGDDQIGRHARAKLRRRLGERRWGQGRGGGVRAA